MEHGYFCKLNQTNKALKDISFLKKNYRIKPLSKLSLLPEDLFGEDRILAFKLVCDDKMFFEQNRVGFNFKFFTYNF